jgi:Chromo (CHRromatin Organisation MOdifier) domain
MEFAIAPTKMTASSKEVVEEGPEEMVEFVVERIVSHRKDEHGIMYLKIRWFGYGPDADTWEQLRHVPQEMTRRYVKRKKLRLTEFLFSTKHLERRPKGLRELGPPGAGIISG